MTHPDHHVERPLDQPEPHWCGWCRWLFMSHGAYILHPCEAMCREDLVGPLTLAVSAETTIWQYTKEFWEMWSEVWTNYELQETLAHIRIEREAKPCTPRSP